MRKYRFNLPVFALVIFFSALCQIHPLRANDAESSSSPYVSSPKDLTVSPPRVVFENGARSAQVSLINNSNRTLTYALSFRRMRMLENGGMEDVITPLSSEKFVDEMVRFTPRRVVLQPRQIQTVRLRAFPHNGILDGEYRTFLNFAVVPNVREMAPLDNKQPGGGLKINLTPVYGVAIPVVLRIGALQVTSRLVGLKVQVNTKNEQLLSMTIEREGTRSANGDLEVLWSASGTKTVQVARIVGVSVLTPLAKRNILMQLRHPEGIRLGHGTLKVRYLDSVDRHVLAEGQLIL